MLKGAEGFSKQIMRKKLDKIEEVRLRRRMRVVYSVQNCILKQITPKSKNPVSFGHFSVSIIQSHFSFVFPFLNFFSKFTFACDNVLYLPLPLAQHRRLHTPPPLPRDKGRLGQGGYHVQVRRPRRRGARLRPLHEVHEGGVHRLRGGPLGRQLRRRTRELPRVRGPRGPQRDRRRREQNAQRLAHQNVSGGFVRVCGAFVFLDNFLP